MTDTELNDLAERWEGVTKGYRNLTFDGAHADMLILLAEVRKQEEMRREIARLRAHVAKRNADMQAFVAEVARMANQKYSDIGT
jgi:cell division protein FtsB